MRHTDLDFASRGRDPSGFTTLADHVFERHFFDQPTELVVHSENDSHDLVGEFMELVVIQDTNFRVNENGHALTLGVEETGRMMRVG